MANATTGSSSSDTTIVSTAPVTCSPSPLTSVRLLAWTRADEDPGDQQVERHRSHHDERRHPEGPWPLAHEVERGHRDLACLAPTVERGVVVVEEVGTCRDERQQHQRSDEDAQHDARRVEQVDEQERPHLGERAEARDGGAADGRQRDGVRPTLLHLPLHGLVPLGLGIRTRGAVVERRRLLTPAPREAQPREVARGRRRHHHDLRAHLAAQRGGVVAPEAGRRALPEPLRLRVVRRVRALTGIDRDVVAVPVHLVVGPERDLGALVLGERRALRARRPAPPPLCSRGRRAGSSPSRPRACRSSR